MKAAFGRIFLTCCLAACAAGPAYAFDGADKSTPSNQTLDIFKDPRQALEVALENYRAGNPASSVEALKYAAAGGEPLAQWKLGKMYADGDGVPRDDYKAYQYFQQIVDKYDEDNVNWREKSVVASAFVAVGVFELKGIPGSRLKADPDEAMRLFLYAATNFGDSNAQYNLARLYMDGAGGLAKRVPPVIGGPGKALVYGHGVFTIGRQGFADAFRSMVEVENWCRAEYLRRLAVRVDRPVSGR